MSGSVAAMLRMFFFWVSAAATGSSVDAAVTAMTVSSTRALALDVPVVYLRRVSTRVMVAERRSAFQQAGIQIDRALWCLQDHPGSSLALGLPTLAALAAVFVPALLTFRVFEFPWYLWYLIYMVGLPTAAAMILTFCPLPAAVFVHGLATGRRLTPAACLRTCLGRPVRLCQLAAGFVVRYVFYAALFGLPALVLWPRDCLATHVALFEDERRVFWRSRKLLKEEAREVHHLLALYTGIVIVFGVLVYTPRMIVSTRHLGLSGLPFLRENLAMFEAVGICLVLVAMATSWTVSLTFLYLEARAGREGAGLRYLLDRVKARYAVGVLTGRAPR